MIRTLSAWLISVAASAAAEMSFDWPVACTLGEDCFIQNYVDVDPGPGTRDFTCGPLSYDGHKGTDIALPLRRMMEADIAVIAAAPGIVQGIRDGMADRLYDGQDLDGRDCGNGVVIDHGSDWVTQYCHLRKGSVAVRSGERVESGTPLGTIGLSGRTQFSHLHFAIRHRGEIVDPFQPGTSTECGRATEETLWSLPVGYVAGGLLDAGFATGIPDYDAIKRGDAAQDLTVDAPIVLFGFAFGARPGDVMRIVIEGPKGEVFRTDAEIDRHRAQLFRAGGRRAPANGWPPGLYRGQVDLIRDGITLSQRIVTVPLR